MWSIIVRYGEIALKSKPVRFAFERQLVSNIKKMLAAVPHRIRRIRGRIFVDTSQPKRVAKILSGIPGIVSCSPSVKTSSDLSQIVPTAVKLAKKFILPNQKFAVRTRRRGKHTFTSREVNERVGAEILRSISGVKVDLSRPDVEIFIEIWDTEAYVFSKILPGVGGMPVGTQGKVLLWFSGNRQDLRAAYLMLKKGCEVELLAPKCAKTVAQARKLLQHHHTVVIHRIHVSHLQNFIPKKDSLMLRRLLVRLGDLMAKRTQAMAIVFSDGANLLTSRGLEWIKLADEASELPVFRPLLGEELQNLKSKHMGRKRAPSSQKIKTEESTITDDFISQLLNQVETEFLKVMS